jgi:hypothetical protein
MAKTYRDTGLILKRNELGEADSIILLLTRQQGLVRVAAKGVRKMKSRKGGNVELFNQIDALIAEGRSLDILVEATAVDSFEHWRQELNMVSYAYYVTDVTTMMLAEGEQYAYVYDRLVEFYSWLGRVESNTLLVRWYEVQLLNHLGYWSTTNLYSDSTNALALLNSFGQMGVAQLANMRPAEKLSNELERLMRQQLVYVLEREPKSEAFMYMVRDLESR